MNIPIIIGLMVIMIHGIYIYKANTQKVLNLNSEFLNKELNLEKDKFKLYMKHCLEDITIPAVLNIICL